jgi:hypothetical protein
MRDTSPPIPRDNTSGINASIAQSSDGDGISDILEPGEPSVNKNHKSYRVSDTLPASTPVAGKLGEPPVDKSPDESEDEKGTEDEEETNLSADEEEIDLSADEELLDSLEDQYAFLD